MEEEYGVALPSDLAIRGRRMARALRLGVLAWLVCLPGAVHAQEAPPRLLTYDDVLRLEGLGVDLGGPPIAFSPDGSEFAYVRLRSTAELTTHDQRYLRGNARGDIWVAPTAGGEPVRVTPGATDGFGYWAPRWSPDGQRLAMFSNQDDEVRVYVWEQATGTITRASDRGADTPTGSAGPVSVVGPPVWLSDTELAFAVLPEGGRTSNAGRQRWTPETASDAWARVRGGTEVTASVIESGVPVDLGSRPQGALLLYDARTNRTSTLLGGNVRQIVPAPTRGLLAVFVDADRIHQPRAGGPPPFPAPFNRLGYRIHLVTSDGALFEGDALAATARTRGYLEWAPDGSRFAFEGAPEGEQYPGELGSEIVVVTTVTGALERLEVGDLRPLTPLRLRLTNEGGLLVLARETDDSQPHWWLAEGSGRFRNLTGSLPTTPAQLHRVDGGGGWAAISQGNVWLIPEDGNAPTNLTEALQDPVAQLAWADEERARSTGISEVLVHTRPSQGEESVHRVELRGGSGPEQMKIPRASARPMAYSTEAGVAAFGAEDRTGTHLWLVGPGEVAPRLVFETNLFLRGVQEGEVRTFEYESLDGDSLIAWVLLPPEEAQHRMRDGRYPLVTRLYPGEVMGPLGPPWGADQIHHVSFLSMQLVAANGYAVLFPSMPRSGDPYLELRRGVLPAVDRAVELGIGDPDRLAIMGESAGGTATYGLIAETDRFHAAIALWGVTNLVGFYGQFESELRYTDNPHEHHSQMFALERFTGFDVPPWEDIDRYVRNSPIVNVGQVETPVLIIHGDLDFIGIQHAEEYFTGLYRQGKRARFVRYWGETHGFHSPANIRDLLGQILDWLDEHLTGSDPAPPRGGAHGSSGEP
jgi:dipeptidyl aminopeptidase/acylaminoacyl peptidase